MLFSIYDTETTGLPNHFKSPLAKQPRVIEFGGIVTDGASILKTLEFKCNPGIEIESIITKITGITNDDLRDKPPFQHFLPDLKDYFAGTDASIAHNASFDKNMLTFALRRIDKDLTAISFPQLAICTVEQTMPIFGRRMKLTELYSHYVGPYEQKHRALDDVMMLFAVCKEIGLFDAMHGEVDE